MCSEQDAKDEDLYLDHTKCGDSMRTSDNVIMRTDTSYDDDCAGKHDDLCYKSLRCMEDKIIL